MAESAMNVAPVETMASFSNPNLNLVVRTHEYHEELLPKPVGWRIMIEPLEVNEETAGGIQLVQEHIEAKKWNQYVGRVLAMGPACYQHPKFLGAGPWCKVGDWILFGNYAGLAATVRDKNGEKVKLRFTNDDAVLGTAEDPRAFEVDV